MELEITLTAVMGLIVAGTAFGGRGRLQQNLAIMRQYRLRHILSSIVLDVIIVAAALGLMALSPVFVKNPILWAASALFHWGSGKGGGSILLSGLQWKWYAVFFLPVLIIALPRFAQIEEEQYRDGTRNWLDGTYRSIRFGLVHMIMLIPLGACLALSVAGAWFTHQYFKGGVRQSTIYHAAFNTVVITTVFIILMVTW